MKIALIGSPDSKCGISTYTKYLANALDELKQDTITHQDIPLIEYNSLPLVHVQHEFGLYPDLLDFFDKLKKLSRKHSPVFATFHTVARPPKLAGFFSGPFPKNIRYLVHSYDAVFALADYGIEAEYMPHGVQVVPEINKEEARRKLQVPQDVFLWLNPGFIDWRKGQEEILEGFAYASRIPMMLAIIGAYKRVEVVANIKSAISVQALERRVHFDPVFQDNLNLWYEACDGVVVGAGEESPLAASGIVHEALGYGLPIVAKDSDIYRSTKKGVVYYRNSEDLGIILRTLTTHSHLRDQLGTEAVNYAHENSWLKVAEKHLRLYQDC